MVGAAIVSKIRAACGNDGCAKRVTKKDDTVTFRIWPRYHLNPAWCCADNSVGQSDAKQTGQKNMQKILGERSSRRGENGGRL